MNKFDKSLLKAIGMKNILKKINRIEIKFTIPKQVVKNLANSLLADCLEDKILDNYNMIQNLKKENRNIRSNINYLKANNA